VTDSTLVCFVLEKEMLYFARNNINVLHASFNDEVLILDTEITSNTTPFFTVLCVSLRL
jgi:hypothetical protein